MKTGIPIIVATLATRAIDPRRSHLTKKSKKPLSNRWLKKRLKNHAIAMVVRRLKKKNISQRWAFWELISHSVRGSASSWLVSSAGFVAEGSTLLSFGASHHKHFGMSSPYSLPHFLQIIWASPCQCRKNPGAGAGIVISSVCLSNGYCFIVGAWRATGASCPCFLNRCFTSVPKPRNTR